MVLSRTRTPNLARNLVLTGLCVYVCVCVCVCVHMQFVLYARVYPCNLTVAPFPLVTRIPTPNTNVTNAHVSSNKTDSNHEREPLPFKPNFRPLTYVYVARACMCVCVRVCD